MSALMDPLALSSLLASRLCHDLVNPVGALSAGLEVLNDEQDPIMREEAHKLVALSTDKSIAMLTFARLAFGAGGAYGQEIDLDEAKGVTSKLYDHVKADLDWRLPGGAVPKDYCKAVLNIALVIADCVPRAGSRIVIEGDITNVVFTGEGPRAKLKEQLVDALSGKSDGLEAKMTPAYLAAMIVSKAGGEICCELAGEEKVTITASFPEFAHG